MKSHLLLAISLGLVLIQISCKQNQQKTEPVATTTAPQPTANTPIPTALSGAAPPSAKPTEMVVGDIRIVNYTNTGARSPQLGEVALAFVSNWVGDTAIASSRVQFGGAMPIPVVDVKTITDAPLMYAILHMGLGDSISVFRPIDAGIMSVLPPHLKKEKMMRADVVLVDIKDAKDVKIPDIPKVIHK